MHGIETDIKPISLYVFNQVISYFAPNVFRIDTCNKIVDRIKQISPPCISPEERSEIKLRLRLRDDKTTRIQIPLIQFLMIFKNTI